MVWWRHINHLPDECLGEVDLRLRFIVEASPEIDENVREELEIRALRDNTYGLRDPNMLDVVAIDRLAYEIVKLFMEDQELHEDLLILRHDCHRKQPIFGSLH